MQQYLDFLHRLNYRVGSAHEKRIASLIWAIHKKLTVVFTASSVRYRRVELMRFSS